MTILISLLLSFQVFAQQTFIPIKKGEPAPIDGYVISLDNEKKIRQDVSDLRFENEKLRQLGVLDRETIALYKSKSEMLYLHNQELRDQLKDSNSQIRSTGYFILGGLVATVVAFSAARAVK